MRVVPVLAILVAMLIMAACGGPGDAPPPDDSGTSTSTLRPRITPAPSVTSTITQLNPASGKTTLDVSREEFYQRLVDSAMGWLPLNKHTEDWYSTMLPNSDIPVDLFGPSDNLQATEMWFRPRIQADLILTTVDILIAATIPHRQEQANDWFDYALGRMVQTGDHEQVAQIGGVYLTMIYVPDLDKVFFSVDVEPQS